eukprot:TRINITY_DN1132_c0_g2_i2.p1 TRINITY_DN1132_c0_g2~~TRINITY_DN1132_c0_g2_i2.p1  ORF type:complete len:509 (+),score=217.63 TRINITY_DN1132_c0_g2_i2:114-1529(+)
MAANILSEKIMVQQVKALNNLQKQQLKVLADLEKKHAVEKNRLEKANQKQAQLRSKAISDQENQFVKRQGVEMEGLVTKQKKKNQDLIELIAHEQAKQSTAIEFDEEKMNMERRLIRKNIELQLKQQMLHLEERNKLELDQVNALEHLKRNHLVEITKAEQEESVQKFELDLRDLKLKNQISEDQIVQQHNLQAQEQQKHYSMLLKNELREFKEKQKVEMKKEMEIVNMQFKDSSIPSKEIKILKNQQIEKYKQQQEQDELIFQHEQQNRKFHKEKLVQQNQMDQKQRLEEKNLSVVYDQLQYQMEQKSLQRISHFQLNVKLSEEMFRKKVQLLDTQHEAQIKLQQEHHQQMAQLTQLEEDEEIKNEMMMRIEQEVQQLHHRYQQKRQQMEKEHEAFMQQSKNEMMALLEEENRQKADVLQQKHDKQNEVFIQKHKPQIEAFFNAKHQMMLQLQQMQHDQQTKLLLQQFTV